MVSSVVDDKPEFIGLLVIWPMLIYIYIYIVPIEREGGGEGGVSNRWNSLPLNLRTSEPEAIIIKINLSTTVRPSLQ